MIKEEDLRWLKALANDMNSQNNRSTSYPIYCVMDKEEIEDENGDIVKWFDDDWYETTPEDALEGRDDIDMEDEDAVDEAMIDKGCTKRHFTIKGRFTGRVFLTNEAAEEHMTANRHHYSEPYSYVYSGGHSNELARVLTIISQLGDDPNTNSYYPKWN